MSDQARRRIRMLGTDSIRARRRPWAITGLWLWEVCIALLLAWPVSSFVRGVYGSHPLGDGTLFSKTGLALLDLAAHSSGLGYALVGQLALVLGLAWALRAMPLSAVLHTLLYSAPDGRPAGPSFVSGAVGATFVPLLAVDLLMIPIYALVLSVGALAFGKSADAMEPALGEARALLVGAGAGAPFGILLVFVSAFHDLWRASIVRFGQQPFACIGHALRALFRHRSETFLGYLFRGLLGLFTLGLCAVSAHALSPRGETAVLVATGIVQLGAWFRVALRVSWLAHALRVVDRVDEAESEPPEPATTAHEPGTSTP